LVFKGRVAAIETRDQGLISTLELWCESERGQTTTCVVELISP
jgi:hypothetical protein